MGLSAFVTRARETGGSGPSGLRVSFSRLRHGRADENDTMEIVDSQMLDRLIADYRRGTFDREELVRQVMRLASRYDAIVRTLAHGAVERDIGEHVCDWWRECAEVTA